MLVTSGNLDLLALLDGQELPAEMQELLDAISAIVGGGVEASGLEAAPSVTAEIGALLAATDSDTVDDVVAALEAAIDTGTEGAKPLPSQPAATPAATVVATVPADPRPFASKPDDKAPPAPASPVVKGIALAAVGDGANDDKAVPAGKAETEAPAVVPAFAQQLGSRADGKLPAKAAPPVNESLPPALRATPVAVSAVPAGDLPAAGPNTVSAALPVSDGPIGAVIGVPVDGAETVTTDVAPDLKIEVVSPVPTPPAATVELTTGGVQAQPSAVAVATPVDEIPAIPAATSATAPNSIADSLPVTRTLASAGQPDVAAQIVRHARITIAEGGGKASMQLQPPELGRLNLEITVEKGGIVNMHVMSHSQEARALVQSQFTELQSSLQDQGLEVGEMSVSVQDQHESSERQADGGPGGNSDGLGEADSFDPGINPQALRQLELSGYGRLDFSA